MFIHSTTIAVLANIHSVSLRYTGYKPSHSILVQCWVNVVAAHCWFNADKLYSTLAQHYSNTGPAVYCAAPPQQIYPILFQCWFNVFDAGPTLEPHWVIVQCLLGLPCGWRFPLPVARKATYQHYSNLFPLSPNHEYNREYIFFLAPVKLTTDLATSNIVLTCS